MIGPPDFQANPHWAFLRLLNLWLSSKRIRCDCYFPEKFARIVHYFVAFETVDCFYWSSKTYPPLDHSDWSISKAGLSFWRYGETSLPRVSHHCLQWCHPSRIQDRWVKRCVWEFGRWYHVDMAIFEWFFGQILRDLKKFCMTIRSHTLIRTPYLYLEELS